MICGTVRRPPLTSSIFLKFSGVFVYRNFSVLQVSGIEQLFGPIAIRTIIFAVHNNCISHAFIPLPPAYRLRARLVFRRPGCVHQNLWLLIMRLARVDSVPIAHTITMGLDLNFSSFFILSSSSVRGMEIEPIMWLGA